MVELALTLLVHLSAHVPLDSMAPSVNLRLPLMQKQENKVYTNIVICCQPDLTYTIHVHLAGASDAPGGVFAYVGGGVAVVLFIVVLVVIIAVLVAIVCVKKRKTNVNGMLSGSSTCHSLTGSSLARISPYVSCMGKGYQAAAI